MLLSEKDYATIRALRSCGALKDIDTGHLRDQRRFILVACADGDRFPELFDYHRGCCDHEHCSHSQTRNGGALVLAPSSPLGRRGGMIHRDPCIYEIEESCEIKDTKNVMLYAHFPCAAATKFEISAADAFDLLVEAKDHLREQIKGVNVALFVHIDYAGHRQRDEQYKTYFFDRKAFDQWKGRTTSSSTEQVAV